MGEEKGQGFIGKWEAVLESYENEVAFFRGLGIEGPDLVKAKTSWCSFHKCADGSGKWECKFQTGLEVGERTVEFTPGEQETMQFTGKQVKFCISFESATKMVETESSELSGWKEGRITREVNVDEGIITCIHDMEGVTMRYELKRVEELKFVF